MFNLDKIIVCKIAKYLCDLDFRTFSNTFSNKFSNTFPSVLQIKFLDNACKQRHKKQILNVRKYKLVYYDFSNDTYYYGNYLPIPKGDLCFMENVSLRLLCKKQRSSKRATLFVSKMIPSVKKLTIIIDKKKTQNKLKTTFINTSDLFNLGNLEKLRLFYFDYGHIHTRDYSKINLPERINLSFKFT